MRGCPYALSLLVLLGTLVVPGGRAVGGEHGLGQEIAALNARRPRDPAALKRVADSHAGYPLRFLSLYDRILVRLASRPGARPQPLHAVVLGPGSEVKPIGRVSYQAVELAALLAAKSSTPCHLTFVDGHRAGVHAAASLEHYWTGTYTGPRQSETLDTMIECLAAASGGAVSASSLAESVLNPRSAQGFALDPSIRRQITTTAVHQLFEKLVLPEKSADLLIGTVSLGYALDQLSPGQADRLFARLMKSVRPGGKAYFSCGSVPTARLTSLPEYAMRPMTLEAEAENLQQWCTARDLKARVEAHGDRSALGDNILELAVTP
jgi:hypothetical protein